MRPDVHVSRDILYRAISETETLADWFEFILLKGCL